MTDATPSIENLIERLRSNARRYSDTMGLTREGAIRRIGVMHDELLDIADALEALAPTSLQKPQASPDPVMMEEVERVIRQRANRIKNNELGRWWNGLSDTHRAALLDGRLGMSEEAFLAGAIAALNASRGDEGSAG